MLNSNLDLEYLTRQYAVDQRLRIRDILEPDLARRLHRACRDDVPYEYLCHVDGNHLAIPAAELAKLTPKEQNELQEKIISTAGDGIGFFYCGYQMGRARTKTDNRQVAFLHEMFDFVNGDEMLSFIATITGQTDLTGADAQFTRYTTGQFLTRHKDDITAEGRRIAYVMSFSEDWHPDWGGLLQFFENDGTPRDAWIPAFNTLSLFDVRHIHSVTYVTPFARTPRLSLTGWFTA
jgi:Rps23 Pro-64 3,4-dihydroxylase Tpa1-like proline 4-hydroxylase